MDTNDNLDETRCGDGISMSSTTHAIDDLSMLQISDSMFPTGMFASSGGLELMYEQKMITTADDLLGLCKNMIRYQLGTSDCVTLACAYDAIVNDDIYMIKEIDDTCCALKTVPEAREAAIRSGVQLCRCVSEFCNSACLKKYIKHVKDGHTSGVYPVALGICCRALHITKERAVMILLYGFAANMTGAALRLGMIQHFEAQYIIHKLKPTMAEAAAYSIKKNASDVWQFCPHAEIFQMAHARMDTKMFIT